MMLYDILFFYSILLYYCFNGIWLHFILIAIPKSLKQFVAFAL